jgi:hypothetical protein
MPTVSMPKSCTRAIWLRNSVNQLEHDFGFPNWNEREIGLIHFFDFSVHRVNGSKSRIFLNIDTNVETQ